MNHIKKQFNLWRALIYVFFKEYYWRRQFKSFVFADRLDSQYPVTLDLSKMYEIFRKTLVEFLVRYYNKEKELDLHEILRYIVYRLFFKNKQKNITVMQPSDPQYTELREAMDSCMNHLLNQRWLAIKHGGKPNHDSVAGAIIPKTMSGWFEDHQHVQQIRTLEDILQRLYFKIKHEINQDGTGSNQTPETA